MTENEAKKAIMAIWLEKAENALKSAEATLKLHDTISAMNRIYYACFYAINALLCKEGKSYSKHSAVKAEFNKMYVNTGKIDKKWGRFFANLFEDRQEGDYTPIVAFDADDIAARLKQAREFIQILRSLATSS